jgi:hypothetical protein
MTVEELLFFPSDEIKAFSDVLSGGFQVLFFVLAFFFLGKVRHLDQFRFKLEIIKEGRHDSISRLRSQIAFVLLTTVFAIGAIIILVPLFEASRKGAAAATAFQITSKGEEVRFAPRCESPVECHLYFLEKYFLLIGLESRKI